MNHRWYSNHLTVTDKEGRTTEIKKCKALKAINYFIVCIVLQWLIKFYSLKIANSKSDKCDSTLHGWFIS